jgi:hypothetical protein
VIAWVKGISNMAKEIGMSRQGLQKALSTKGNQRLDSINAIMRAMGYQLSRPQKVSLEFVYTFLWLLVNIIDIIGNKEKTDIMLSHVNL